jgi:eukaryotic-like serine/threonine-protein kinase
MTLSAGSRLGPYEILAPIGAGGMGDVYRAKDTRLDRTVAVKVLPSHLSDNTEARQRFDREGRSISSLNHPNICTLHDVGHQDGVDFLVMESLEGETLADRLAKGPLPTELVLKYGIEICEGLERARALSRSEAAQRRPIAASGSDSQLDRNIEEVAGQSPIALRYTCGVPSCC